MQNRNVRELEENLIAVLNASDVLIETKRYVLLSVLRLVEKEADKAIIQETYAETMPNTPIEEERENHAEST